MIPRKETNRVVYHHSLSSFGDVDIIRKWHINRTDEKFEDIGYHFVVPVEGRFQHGRNIQMIGAHALGKNKDSIGVCIVGDFNLYEPSGHQINECARLYHDLCRAYSKTLNIEYHHELCPGFMLDRVAFKKTLLETI